MPNELKIRTTSRNESPDPNAPRHKRIKMGDEKLKENLDLEVSSSEEIIRVKLETQQNQINDLKIVLPEVV
jgi:hypothetical protein